MGERLLKFFSSLKDKWLSLTRKARILIVTISLVVIAGAAIIVYFLNQTNFQVLFKGITDSAEATEIVSIIQEMGIEVKMSNGTIYVPKDQVDSLNMQLSFQGYPKSGLSYDIWDNGIDMLSTDYEKREIKRRQSEARIAAALGNLDGITKADVILDIPETKNTVINETVTAPSISVILHLKSGVKLDNKQIQGIYNLINTTVSTLKQENISISDSTGKSLKLVESSDDPDMELYYARLGFQERVEDLLYDKLGDLLSLLYGPEGFGVTVYTKLNYDKSVTESTTVSPVVGENGLPVEEVDEVHIGSTNTQGGEITIDPNSDLAPDYPTFDLGDDGEFYYDKQKEVKYRINEVKEQVEKDGYSIDDLTVTLVVDTDVLTIADQERLQTLMATAVGTTTDKTYVFGSSFYTPEIEPPITIIEDSMKDILIIAVIALGSVLLILLIFLLVSRKSRKKKRARRKAQEEAERAASDAASAFFNIPEPVGYSIPSLTEAAGQDSKETALKREIADFSKTSPEIVAQIIRSMLKEELD